MTRAFFTRCAAPPHGGGRSSSPASPSSPPDHATPPGDAAGVGLFSTRPTTTTTPSPSLRAKITRVGWSFFWQTPGVLAPYVVALFLVLVSTDTSLQFRTITALGVLPCALILSLSLQRQRVARLAGADGEMLQLQRESMRNSSSLEDMERGGKTGLGGHHRGGSDISPSMDLDHRGEQRWNSTASGGEDEPWTGSGPVSLADRRRHWRTLIGTGGTWFLFDVAYYGVQVFAPFILERISPDASTMSFFRIPYAEVDVFGEACLKQQY